MNIIQLIDKKKNNRILTKEEIEYIINGYVSGEIKDYQMSALLMAICFNGMNSDETAILTETMKNTGEVFDLSGINKITVDKHSTGGVGDKVTIILLPIMASLNIPMLKMSGRGLGFTGGTADKLESFEGFNMDYTLDEAIKMVNKYNICEMTQSNKMCLADKKIYELRGLTSTIDSIPLIASSIMSKKLAVGCDKILLDVTCGNGAFASNIEDARELAKQMVDIGNKNGKETIAVITNMDEPLGKSIGNSLEIIEAIEFLKGRCEEDVLEVIKTLGAYILKLAEVSDDIEKNKEIIEEQIFNGKAYQKFIQWIQVQGGNINQIEDISLLPKAKEILFVTTNENGYISKINSKAIGELVNKIGGGRNRKGEEIDHSVGIILNYKVGDYVENGATLAYIHVNDYGNKEELIKEVRSAFEITENKTEKMKMILDVIM